MTFASVACFTLAHLALPYVNKTGKQHTNMLYRQLSKPFQGLKWIFVSTVLLTLFGETWQINIYSERLSDYADVNVSALLNSFQLGYDKRIRPNYGGPSVEVGVSMFVISISSLSEAEMDFTVDMYFRQFWMDPRLSFKPRPNLRKLVVGPEYSKHIWIPDTFFVNEKVAYFHEATTDNQFLRIMYTGEILRSIRLTITSSCMMALQYFPMDRQTCLIEIESFGYTMIDIHYKWIDGLNSVQISPDVSLPQFKVIGHRQKIVEAALSTGNYSRLACEIQFVRSLGFYLIQIYVPSGLIVAISWVSFWFNRGASVARVNLGVTTVLTMTTLMNATNATLPKISYVKSIDVYLMACFFMVFATLIEYASVGYIAKHIQMKKNRYLAMRKLEGGGGEGVANPQTTSHIVQLAAFTETPNRHNNYQNRHTNGNHRSMTSTTTATTRFHNEVTIEPAAPVSHPLPNLDMKDLNTMLGLTASDIDKYSRVMFPLTFTVFQLMYWMIYKYLSDEQVDDLVYLEKDD